MSIQYSQLKRSGRNSLKGKWGLAIGVILIIGILSVAVSYIPRVGFLLSILLFPMTVATTWFFLGLARNENPTVEVIFSGYEKGAFIRTLGTQLLMNIYLVLWALLLLIPAIIKGFSYMLTNYILKDYPHLQYNSAIKLSRRMMDGYKGQAFILQLSFIGWAILCLFTLGIGFLFLSPYVSTTNAHLYEDLKRRYVEAHPDDPLLNELKTIQ
ncbi:DUF975 family protein [Bacillus sp. 1P06AnD]|uniref:DUF975 family protein n=1 Tax=Bacillus sp. 1P06AnD TaxID=3132208 RepID=UPI0039A374E8